jgi:probable HAF family extracellular repeat protein
MRSKQMFKIAPLVAACLIAIAAQPAFAVNYSFSDLGTITGLYAGTGAGANGVNNSGQVAGYNGTGAVRWNGDTLTQLDNGPGAESSIGIGISNSGQVAGYNAFPAADDKGYGIRWDGTAAITLDTLGFGYYNIGIGINDQNQIVGTSWAGSTFHPVRWDGSAITDLGTLGGGSGEAWGINEAGQVVGHSNTTGDDADHATLWNGGAIIDLGTLGGTNSSAISITDKGIIVGSANTANDLTNRATLWDASTGIATDLGSLVANLGSSAGDINNQGQIVGSSDLADGSAHATLWDNGNIIDLQQYLPSDLANAGWVLFQANAISDNGIIVGWASKGSDPNTAEYASFKLTPSAVPIPGAVWLFGSSLAGYVRLRKRLTLNAA